MKKYRFSPERAKIYQVLCSTKSHPTAEWLFSQLQEQGEKISLATVYRNLTILCDQGKAKKLDIQGETHAHFDGDVSDHHHFICKKWNKIMDVHKLPTGFSSQLQHYAICFTCL